jgi:hypothetical protein
MTTKRRTIVFAICISAGYALMTGSMFALHRIEYVNRAVIRVFGPIVWMVSGWNNSGVFVAGAILFNVLTISLLWLIVFQEKKVLKVVFTCLLATVWWASGVAWLIVAGTSRS